jgi:hypothetical protein
MTTVIQTVASDYATRNYSILASISQLAQAAKALLTDSDDRVTLGATLELPVTYNAAGRFGSRLQTVDALAADALSSIRSGSNADISNDSRSVANQAAQPTTTITAKSPAETAAAASTETTAAASSVNASNTSVTATTLASRFPQDSTVQAFATISGNPAYANLAAGLYMSVATFRAEQSAAATRLNVPDSVPPVSSVTPVNAVAQSSGWSGLDMKNRSWLGTAGLSQSSDQGPAAV